MTQTEQQNVPALRFPEFDGKWRPKRLGQIAQLTSSKRVYLSDYVEIGVPFFRGKEISEMEKGVIPDDVLYISRDAFDRFRDKYGAPRAGDILITAVGTLANVFRVRGKQEFYFKDGNLIWFRAISEESTFLEKVLKFNRHIVLRSAIGSSQKALTIIELKKLIFSFPALPEQRKIAGFLGAVDERIAQVTRKKALLEDYKKGCMQQLFSQSIRFKDDQGNDFPDWEEKRLGEKVQVLAGLTYSPDDIRENGTLVLRSSNVQSGEIALEDNVYVDLKTSKANMSKKYDILLCVRNGSQRLIGKSAIIKKHMENTTHGAFMTVLRGEDNLFIFQLLQTQLFFKEVHKNLGATINSINGSDLKKMRFFIPSSKDERRKIADFLSAIDTKIDLVAQELEQAKTFKKGLLQQMFV